MKISPALNVLVILSALWAATPPAIYGFLFLLAGDLGALISLSVIASYALLVLNSFSKLSFNLWSASFVVLSTATSIGFFHNFQASGESAPLPYEWLNGYYEFTGPLIVLVSLNRYLQSRENDS